MFTKNCSQFFSVCRFVGFFSRRSAEDLWRTTTATSKMTKMRGGGKYRRKPVWLSHDPRGIGKIKVNFPGLNDDFTPKIGTRFEAREEPEVLEPDTIIGNPDRQPKTAVDVIPRSVIRRSKERPHPLVRGWTHSRMLGEITPAPLSAAGETIEGYKCICIKAKYVASMDPRVKRKRTAWVLMLAGNGNGSVGFGLGRSGLMRNAIEAAKRTAMRRIVSIERLENRTIYQSFWAEMGHSRIFAESVPQGSGLRCHRVIEAICKLAGIKDIKCIVDNSTKNYLAIVNAFFHGLVNQETFQQLADRKRLHVVEFRPENNMYPVVVASPKSNPVRSEEELDAGETLDVDEMYGGSRIKLNRNRKWIKPKAQTIERLRYRNLDKLRLQLQVDGVVNAYTATEVHKWKADQERLVEEREKLMPQGLGLLEIVPRPKEEEANN